MADGTGTISGLPEGYTLEQEPTEAKQPSGGVSGLPEGYTLETDDNTPSPTDKQAAYRKATAAGPFTQPGAAEKAMGEAVGDTKAQVKAAAKNLGMAALVTGAGVTGATAATALTEAAPNLIPSVVDKAKAVVEWAKTNPIKATAIETIAHEMGVDPFQLMHNAVKYGKNLFGVQETTKSK
jgi:hypothetical protein